MSRPDDPVGAPRVIIPTESTRRRRFRARDYEYLAFGIFPLILLVMSCFALPSAIKLDQSLSQSGLPAIAVVTDTTWIKWGPDITFITYRTAAGSLVKSEIDAPNTPTGGWSDGTKIPILYLPSDPKVARYAKWKATWNALIFPVAPGVVFGLLFIGLSYEKYGRGWRRRERVA